ncbi:MAG: UDP-glucose 4-epimerase GalE [Sporichthyaceae bacterium]
MTWLLTGGAGYIGAHVLAAMRARGHQVVVLDDLSTGLRDRVPAAVPFVHTDLADTVAVTAAIRRFGISGVVHLAAKKSVPESVADPLRYYRENVGGLGSLLTAMAAGGVCRMLYSSSAAVYGAAGGDQVDEASPAAPQNPYGSTKLIGEWMVAQAGAVTGLAHLSLRYFNVAGSGAPELGDTGTDNLIPQVFRAVSQGLRPQVFGGDYPTRDGSCVRDFIHVQDVADAHLVAAEALLDARGLAPVYNVGRGVGVTVKEVLASIADVTGHQRSHEVIGRRAGDPAQVVAAVELIATELGWRARHDLTDMVSSAWQGWCWRGGAHSGGAHSGGAHSGGRPGR